MEYLNSSYCQPIESTEDKFKKLEFENDLPNITEVKSCKTCNRVEPCGQNFLCKSDGDFARWTPIPQREINNCIAGMGQDAPKTGTTGKAKHYQVGNQQPIEIMQATMSKEQFEGYLLGNVIKYSLRLNHKGQKVSDVGKCYQYNKWLCQLVNGEKLTVGGK